MAFQIGQRVGDYEILQMVGAGGMGHVYRVRNIISNRIEAMKVLLPDLAAEPDLAVRFISEIRTLASFDHPNIALLHTAFQSDNQLVMMMEFVEGFTLDDRGKKGSIPGGEVVQIISQALSALSYAHGRGVVHRDIKPANIMVTSHGVAKLMDFGIAKSKVGSNLTQPGTTMGSLYYMSPEQVRGGTIDARSDLYSIGIVLYELLAGVRPFEGDTTFGILNQQLNVKPRPPIEINPSLPSGLNEIILMALAKDPAERFQSADAFRNALKTYATHPRGEVAEQVAAQPVAAQPPPNPPVVAPAAVPPLPVSRPVAASASVPSDERHKQGNKVVWIATGAIAAVLALVAVAVTVPRYMHAHAASSAVGTAPTEPVVTTPPLVADTPTSPSSPNNPTTTVTPTPVAPPDPSGSGTSGRKVGTGPPRPAGGGQMARSSPPAPKVKGDGIAPGAGTDPAPPSASNRAELDQLQEQLIQLNARASAARHGVQQIRDQQEQMGLGLRGDVEAAESRLDAYLHAATNDLRSGNASGASRDMEKADTEIATLEKFLGH